MAGRHWFELVGDKFTMYILATLTAMPRLFTVMLKLFAVKSLAPGLFGTRFSDSDIVSV